MLLQTDPTVIYGMGETFDGNIRKRDLTADTPVEHLYPGRPAADADRHARHGLDPGGAASAADGFSLFRGARRWLQRLFADAGRA